MRRDYEEEARRHRERQKERAQRREPAEEAYRRALQAEQVTFQHLRLSPRTEPERIVWRAELQQLRAAARKASSEAAAAMREYLDWLNSVPENDRGMVHLDLRLAQDIASHERYLVFRDMQPSELNATSATAAPLLGPILRTMRVHAHRHRNDSLVEFFYGFTQQELGDLVGLTEGAVRHIETGRNQPTVDRVAQWAAACGYFFILRFMDYGAEDPSEEEQIIDQLPSLPHDAQEMVRDLVRIWRALPPVLQWDLKERIRLYTDTKWDKKDFSGQ